MSDVPAPVTPQEALCTPFRIRRILGGYDPDRVDDLLDDVADTLRDVVDGRTPALTADDVVRAVLPKTRPGRPGYDPYEVDQFLDRVADTLEAA